MSDVLGYQRGVSYNNDIINRNRALQREVHNENLNNLNNYNILEKQSQKTYDTAERGLEEAKASRTSDEAKDEGGEFLNDVRNAYKSGKAYNKIFSKTAGDVSKALSGGAGAGAEGLTRASFLAQGSKPAGELFTSDLARESGEAEEGARDVSEATDLVRAGGESDADVNAVLDFGRSIGDRIVGGADAGSRLGEVASSRLGGAVAEGTQALTNVGESIGDVGGAVREGATALAGGDVGGVAGALAKGSSGISKISGALDSLGKAGEGLSVLSGGSDLLDDMTGGFSKMNTGEKVGNIAGITSGVFGAGSLAGSLEGAGAMLDATGVGAELGVALNVAGAIAGGISALGDYIGSKEKQKKQAPRPTPVAPPTAVPTPQAPISALQSGGVALAGYN